MNTTANFANLSNSELVAFYNDCAAKLGTRPVTRFSDRAAAVRRCEKLSNELIEKLALEAEAAAEQSTVERSSDEVAIDTLDAEMLGTYGRLDCPACGVHLSNGVGEDRQEVNGRVIRHERFQFECLACGAEFGPAVERRAPAQPTGIPRPALAASLKLDRTLRCCDTGETWKNAYRMWKEHSDWMTSAQQDRLTRELYTAAKAGERRVVTVNGRSFELVNVPSAA